MNTTLANTCPRLKAEVERVQDLHQGFLHVQNINLTIERFDGNHMHGVQREFINKPPAAAALLFDPVLDNVVMIEQFRVGAFFDHPPPSKNNGWSLGIVAGIHDKANETSAELIKREAIEEAGCTILGLLPIQRYLVSPGFTNEAIDLFLGIVDSTSAGGIHGVASENEDIKVHVLSFSELTLLYDAQKITSATTLIAVQWLLLNTQKARDFGLNCHNA